MSEAFSKVGRYFIGHGMISGEGSKTRQALERAFDKYGFIPYYADDETEESPILMKICQKIYLADIVVFDVSRFNLDSLIEIGISLAFNKNLLITANKESIVPAALKTNVIYYSNPSELTELINKEIKVAINNKDSLPGFCNYCRQSCESMFKRRDKTPSLSLLVHKGLLQRDQARTLTLHIESIIKEKGLNFSVDQVKEAGVPLCKIRSKAISAWVSIYCLDKYKDEDIAITFGMMIGNRKPWLVLNQINSIDYIPKILNGVSRIDYKVFNDLDEILKNDLSDFWDSFLPSSTSKATALVQNAPFWSSLDDWIESSKQETTSSTLVEGNLQLIQIIEQGLPSRFSISEKGLLIGRGEASSIILTNSLVSTKHALLSKQYNDYYLQDLRSKNGTFINGSRLPLGGIAKIALGDKIRIGHSDKFLIWDESPLPPIELIDKSTDIIRAYRRNLQKITRKVNEAKIILIGQGSVGKTSIVQQILDNKSNPNQGKTDGISIKQWKIDDQYNIGSQTLSIQINIWDFGGQEIMHATHQFFLTKRSLYLLVLDSRLTQEENRVEYWLTVIQSFGGESPVLIVGNKIDQHPLDIDRTGLQKKYPNIVGILETSAATGAGIEELKAAITEQVNQLPHVRDLLPETWFTVKTKLEELGKQSNFITHDKYLDLCAENEVSDETSQRTLIGFLHDLGVVLHFQDDPRLEALGILNPQWVTNGVYKILNSHALFQNKGVLTVSMLDEVLNLPEYPRGKRLFIVDMMKKFELCYEMPYGYDIESDKTFLVPDLLPKDQSELTFNGIPAFEYAYPVLPSSVITRFIVRMNQKIDDGFVWRTGVVLKIGENKALVKADIEDRKITIAIDGLEHTRRDALSAIRFQLDEIHGSIKGLDAQKRVPIPNAPNAEPLEYEYLLMLEREGDETCRVKDGSKLVTVNVRQILSGIESETARKEVASRVINIYGDVNDSNILTGDENEVNK